VNDAVAAQLPERMRGLAGLEIAGEYGTEKAGSAFSLEPPITVGIVAV